METIKLEIADDSELRQALSELSELDLDLCSDVESRLLHSFFDAPLDFIEVQLDTTVRTRKNAVRIKRGQRLNDLLSALRTRHINHAAILSQLG